jgi:hypothetical protein
MKKAIIFLFIMYPMVGFAQVNIYINGIAGSYQMNDMKSLQKEIKSQFIENTIPIGATYKFPMSLQGEFKIEYESEQLFTYGGFINYAMTKGRLFYGDYSGRTTANQNINRIVIGAIGTIKLNELWSYYSKLGINLSSLNLAFDTHVDSMSELQKIGFNSRGLCFEPGFALNIATTSLILQFTGGYELNIQGLTKFAQNSDAYLLVDGRKAYLNWSGFRIGMGIGFTIN